MISSTHRNIPNASIYISFLDTFLEGISEQRHRIKKTVTRLDQLKKEIFTPDGTQEMGNDFLYMQRRLFREIRVFFWWWHSTYVILWTGEKSPATGKMTDFLVKILDDRFEQGIESYKLRAKKLLKKFPQPHLSC